MGINFDNQDSSLTHNIHIFSGRGGNRPWGKMILRGGPWTAADVAELRHAHRVADANGGLLRKGLL